MFTTENRRCLGGVFYLVINEYELLRTFSSESFVIFGQMVPDSSTSQVLLGTHFRFAVHHDGSVRSVLTNRGAHAAVMRAQRFSCPPCSEVRIAGEDFSLPSPPRTGPLHLVITFRTAKSGELEIRLAS
jgi:hypothetical protein